MHIVTAELENQDKISVEKKGEFLWFAAKGCQKLLDACLALNEKRYTSAFDIKMPEGNGHVDMLLREVLLKAKAVWSFPYSEEELCHCRAIATKTVDQSIVNGLHSVEEIGKYCSAGVTCGNCRTDIENILKYRKA